MAAGRLVVVWLGAGRCFFAENRDGEILGLGRRVRAPTGLRLGLGLGFWADVAGSSRPKSGMIRDTPPMTIVTGCSLVVGGLVGADGLTTGGGLMVPAVGGVRVFATARSFCCRFRGSNLSLFPTTSRPISKYVASGGGSL